MLPSVLVTAHRDENTCCYCHTWLATQDLTVDHVIPAAAGGPDLPENLHTACEPCNTSKACYWLPDLTWTAEEQRVGFPPAVIGRRSRPCPFTPPADVSVDDMASLCGKVRRRRVASSPTALH